MGQIIPIPGVAMLSVCLTHRLSLFKTSSPEGKHQPQSCWSRLFFAVFFAVILLPSLQGCDKHKAEREQIAEQLSSQQAELREVRSRHDNAQNTLNRMQETLSSQRADLASGEQDLAERQAQIMVYMSENKATILALAAAGTGAATALDDETRRIVQQELGQGSSDLIVAAGIFGAGYCLFNLDKCSRVSARLAAHSSEIRTIKTQIQRLTLQVEEQEQSIQQQQSQIYALNQQVQEQESTIRSNQQRMAELDCRDPLCKAMSILMN